ncbi:MAG: transaldolase family protein [Candidatus Woesearchaeota archaeon]
MKIFIDSAKLDEIEHAYCCGILDGVTTNPSLIKKAVDALKESGKRISVEAYIKKILITAKGTPVSLEVTDFTYDKMVKQGKALFKRFNPVAKNVYIKIPVNPSFEGHEADPFDGIKAIKTLSKARIPINCTLIFTPEQALMAAKAGAKFVSPFAGRIDDAIRTNHGIPFDKTDYFPSYGWHTPHGVLEDNGIISGIELVKQCVDIFKKHNIKAEVLAASIRNARQAREAALVGADIATLPLKTIEELLKHYKTEEGMKKFTADVIPEYVKLTK